MNNIKFSIVTPSFNQGQFIEEAILSVLNQGYENFEHIIIDACSTDNTIDILKKYPHLIWLSEPDEGQSDALNKGFKMAKADWIIWLNADDFLLPDTMHNYLKIINNRNNFNVIHGHVKFFNDISMNVFKRHYLTNFNKYRTIFRITTPPSSGTLYLKELLIKEPLNVDFHYMMDSEWYMRCSELLNIKVIDKFMIKFRVSDFNKTSEQIKTGKLNERQIIEEKELHEKYLLPLVDKYPKFVQNLILKLGYTYLKFTYRLSKISYYIFDFVCFKIINTKD